MNGALIAYDFKQAVAPGRRSDQLSLRVERYAVTEDRSLQSDRAKFSFRDREERRIRGVQVRDGESIGASTMKRCMNRPLHGRAAGAFQRLAVEICRHHVVGA